MKLIIKRIFVGFSEISYLFHEWSSKRDIFTNGVAMSENISFGDHEWNKYDISLKPTHFLFIICRISRFSFSWRQIPCRSTFIGALSCKWRQYNVDSIRRRFASSKSIFEDLWSYRHQIILQNGWKQLNIAFSVVNMKTKALIDKKYLKT